MNCECVCSYNNEKKSRYWNEDQKEMVKHGKRKWMRDRCGKQERDGVKD